MEKTAKLTFDVTQVRIVVLAEDDYYEDVINSELEQFAKDHCVIVDISFHSAPDVYFCCIRYVTKAELDISL